MILLVLMGLALFLRLRHLGDQSLWMDEANAFYQSAGTWTDVLETSRTSALDFPLERFILHPLTTYPPNEFFFRLPAALWGVLGVALTYALARQVWDRETALLAAGLLALSPYHISYSQEARNYTSFLVLHLLSLTALVQALRRPGRRSWTLYALSVVPGLYDHLYVFLTLGIQFVLHGMLCVLAMRRRELSDMFSWRSLRAHGWALLGAGMLFLPWVAFVLAGPGFSSRAGALSGIFRAPGVIRFEPDLFLRMLCWFFGNQDTAGPMFWAGLAGIGAVLILPTARRRLAWLNVVYIVGVFLAVAVLSRVSGTYLAYRRLLFLQPILFILMAGGMLTALRPLWRWLARREGPPAGVLVPMALLLLAGAVWAPAIQAHYRSEKENWRALTEVLLAQAGPEDWIVNCADSPNAWKALRVYLGPHESSISLLTPAQGVQRLSAVSPRAIWYILPVPPYASAPAGWPFNDPDHLRQLDGDRSLPPHALMLSLERWDTPANLLDVLERVYVTGFPIPLDWRFSALNAAVTWHDIQGEWAPALHAYQQVMEIPSIPASIRHNLESLAQYIEWDMGYAGTLVPGAYWDEPEFRAAVLVYLRARGADAETAEQLRAQTLMLAHDIGDELPAGAFQWRFEQPEDLLGWELPLAGATAELVQGECGGMVSGCLRIQAAGAGYHGSLRRPLHLEPGRAYLLRCTIRTASELSLQGKVLYASYRQGWRRPGTYASAFWGTAGWQTFIALLVPPAGISEITLSPVMIDHAGTVWIAEVSVIPLSP